MALITSYSVEKNRNSMAGLSAYENGGKGSGNFGHEGRPGEVGGSGDGNGSDSKNNKEKPNKSDYISQLDDKYQKLVRDALKEAGIEGEDLERAMDSKLVDLEDTIDIDEIIKEEKNSLEKILTDTIMKILNGGKGSGNFDHAGRPGEVGGSAPSGTGGSASSNEKKQKPLYDDGDLGTAPLIAVEDHGRYKAKSFASEEDTRKLLEADGNLKKVAELAYDKSIKGEKPTEAQQMVFQQITGIRQLLQQKVGEMGDTMTFIDKKMDWDNFDAVMDHTAEFLTKARLAAMGDKSKIGGKLNEAISTLSNVRDRIVDLGSPDRLNRGGEPSWYDIDDMVKRRKR